MCCDERGHARSTSCAVAATRSTPSSTPSTYSNWTVPTCAASRSKFARPRWRASCVGAATGSACRRAFCCRGCHQQFYRKRCVVCEKDKTNPNAIICHRRPCRAEARKWPTLYRYPARDGQSPTTCKVDARSAHSTGLKTRSVTGRAPRNLVGGYRFPNATEIEADLAYYIRAIEALLLRDEPAVELPTVESLPLISPRELISRWS